MMRRGALGGLQQRGQRDRTESGAESEQGFAAGGFSKLIHGGSR